MFHRIDDMYLLDAPTLLRYAIRLAAYEGVLRARIMAEAADQPPSRQPGRAARAAGDGRMRYDQPDTISAASVARDPTLASLFSFGTADPT